MFTVYGEITPTMACTYDPAQCAADTGTPNDAVRFLLGDTELSCVEMQDEEIAAQYSTTPTTLTQYQRVYQTAALCATATYRRYARLATVSAGGNSVNPGPRAELWKKIADDMANAARVASDLSGIGVISASRPRMLPTWGDYLD